MSFKNSTFNIVSCRVAFHHFSHPLKAFSEAKRVLKKEGRFILVDAVSSNDPIKSKFHNRFEKLADPSHVKMYSVLEIKQMLKKIGFKLKANHKIEAVKWVVKDINDKKMRDFDKKRRQKCLIMLENSIKGDKMGLNIRYEKNKLVFTYRIATFVAKKT